MTSVLDVSNSELKAAKQEDSACVALTSFASFVDSFPLQGEKLYKTVFDRHAEMIQTQKARFAVANLEKILTATFEVSAVSGFDRMSLRDLSRQTGMSMGAIYSCISKKEDIALMVADIVRLSSTLTQQHAMTASTFRDSLEQCIKYHLYASTFGINGFEEQIQAGIDAGEFYVENPRSVANAIVVLLEDWYLKPWKTKSLTINQDGRYELNIDDIEDEINKYNQSIIDLVTKLLAKN